MVLTTHVVLARVDHGCGRRVQADTTGLALIAADAATLLRLLVLVVVEASGL